MRAGETAGLWIWDPEVDRETLLGSGFIRCRGASDPQTQIPNPPRPLRVDSPTQNPGQHSGTSASVAQAHGNGAPFPPRHPTVTHTGPHAGIWAGPHSSGPSCPCLLSHSTSPTIHSMQSTTREDLHALPPITAVHTIRDGHTGAHRDPHLHNDPWFPRGPHGHEATRGRMVRRGTTQRLAQECDSP